jgi:hypothetical protein
MRFRAATLPLCLLFVLSHPAVTHAAPPQVEVLAKTAKVKVRKETIATVKKGDKYRLLKTQGPWIAIAMGEGEKEKRGWILASAVKLRGVVAVVTRRVAEERSRGKVSARIRRVRRLGGKGLLGRCLIERAYVRYGLLGGERCQSEAGNTRHKNSPECLFREFCSHNSQWISLFNYTLSKYPTMVQFSPSKSMSHLQPY